MIRGGLPYHIALKQELMAQEMELPCCREAFWAAVLYLRGNRTFFRGHEPLVDTLEGLLRQFLAANPTSQDDGPISIFRKGRLLLINGLNMRSLRKKVANRLEKTQTQGIQIHCLHAFLRGLFCRTGYMQNPEHAYHIELDVSARWLRLPLRYIRRSMHLHFLFCNRRGRKIAYLKGRKSVARFMQAMEFFDLALEIGDLFKVDRVDIINLKTVNDPLLKHSAVFKGKAIFVKDKKLKFRLESQIMKAYEDTKYLREVAYKILAEHVRKGTFGKPLISIYK